MTFMSFFTSLWPLLHYLINQLGKDVMVAVWIVAHSIFSTLHTVGPSYLFNLCSLYSFSNLVVFIILFYNNLANQENNLAGKKKSNEKLRSMLQIPNHTPLLTATVTIKINKNTG